MKTKLRAGSALVALALALATPALAQQPRLGLGVSMNTSLLGDLLSSPSVGFAPPKLYVPFYVAPNLRIEPEIGWISITDDTDSTTSSSFDLGVGALYLKPVVASTSLYGGLRLASAWVRSEVRLAPTVSRKTTQRNTILAPVFGAEYLPSEWFSVGLEGQLVFTFLGDEEANTGGNVTTGRGGSAKSLQGLFFMRVYFL